jgi:hypothetical protein
MLAARPPQGRERQNRSQKSRSVCRHHRLSLPRRSCYLALALTLAPLVSAQAQTDLPDAPAPHMEMIASANPTSAGLAANPDRGFADPVPASGAGQEAFPPQAPVEGLRTTYVPVPKWCIAHACSQVSPQPLCCQPSSDVFDNYIRRNAVHIYTPAQLGRIAINGVIDPFNLLTIGATSLVSVGTDPHSPYGPGARGWAKVSGITLTEDMTGEFFGTFLIPSIDHQDPHYHRMPYASMTRRILHCAWQPFWTVSDTGRGMINYSTIVGSVLSEAVDVTYVPYQQQGWGPGAARIAVGWASAPVGNYVTEFFPDVARHINLKVVFLQRIVNQVAREEGGP